jgi:N-acetylneuraminate synthase/sialic acid synthase
MKLFDLKRRNKKFFVIAEIGHNHQGSIEKAKKLIRAAYESGADAVKFQKRFNKELYTKEFYNRPYEHENSYAKTYGEHRDFLEFNFSEFRQLQKYSRKLGIIFFATAFDKKSVDFLERLEVPCYKIASGDLTNLPLQEYIAKKNKPIFLSTGGGTFNDIDRAFKNINKINKKIIILHCTASYPADIEDMNLNIISELKKKYKRNLIGLSDHENGIDAASIAYMLGSRVFEKHFTLNRAWKGTDQSFSLEPHGLSKLIRNLNRIPKLLGSNKKKFLKKEKNPIYKMSKTIVASYQLKKGQILKLDDLSLKSPGGGMKPYELHKIIGKKLLLNVKKDEILTKRHFK